MGRLLSAVVVVAILAVSLAAAGFLVSLQPEPERREPPPQTPFAVTEPVAAGTGAIPVRGGGTVRPHAEIDVAAEIGGRVVWVNPAFESGGRIGAGQPIFRIDDADYRNRVEQARADVAVQQVEVLRIEEEARIARAQYEQFRRRSPDGAAAEDAGPLAFWQPQLEAAQAVAERHRAALAQAELALSRTEIAAPFDGVVRQETLDAGQFVAAGQSVGRLYAADAVEVVVPLSGADAALVPRLWELRAGSPDRRVAARVSAGYGGGRYAWDGYVDRAETALDERTRTIEVIVRVPRPLAAGRLLDGGGRDGGAGRGGGPPLLLGEFVDVRIQGVAPEKYFRVRRAALRPGGEVWVVRGNRVAIVPVRVLQRADDDVFLTGDLEAGQPVVVGGLQIATEGMVVRTAAGAGP